MSLNCTLEDGEDDEMLHYLLFYYKLKKKKKQLWVGHGNVSALPAIRETKAGGS